MTYTIDTITWRSPNYTIRTGKPESIVCHSCEGALPRPRSSSLPWLCKSGSKVSTGYYVCRPEPDGHVFIYQLVSDDHVAWHAGGLQDDGTWTAQPLYSNPRSIGIECEHRAGQDWPAAQKDALAWLIDYLTAKYHIPIVNIDTHGEIALPGPYTRKHDPSDWARADFIVWRNALMAPTPPPNPLPVVQHYEVIGLPIYEAENLQGTTAGHLKDTDAVDIDRLYANGAGHLKDGRGFVDMKGLATP